MGEKGQEGSWTLFHMKKETLKILKQRNDSIMLFFREFNCRAIWRRKGKRDQRGGHCIRPGDDEDLKEGNAGESLLNSSYALAILHMIAHLIITKT